MASRAPKLRPPSLPPPSPDPVPPRAPGACPLPARPCVLSAPLPRLFLTWKHLVQLDQAPGIQQGLHAWLFLLSPRGGRRKPRFTGGGSPAGPGTEPRAHAPGPPLHPHGEARLDRDRVQVDSSQSAWPPFLPPGTLSLGGLTSGPGLLPAGKRGFCPQAGITPQSPAPQTEAQRRQAAAGGHTVSAAHPSAPHPWVDRREEPGRMGSSNQSPAAETQMPLDVLRGPLPWRTAQSPWWETETENQKDLARVLALPPTSWVTLRG